MRKSFYQIVILAVFFIVVTYTIKQFIFSSKVVEALNNQATTTVTVIMVCGDGVLDPYYEVCDKGNPAIGITPSFGTSTCSNYGYTSGKLRCSDDCTELFTNLCYTCGNGTKE